MPLIPPIKIVSRDAKSGEFSPLQHDTPLAQVVFAGGMFKEGISSPQFYDKSYLEVLSRMGIATVGQLLEAHNPDAENFYRTAFAENLKRYNELPKDPNDSQEEYESYRELATWDFAIHLKDAVEPIVNSMAASKVEGKKDPLQQSETRTVHQKS